MGDNNTHTYQGKEVDVQWNGGLCIHIGECSYSKGELFVGGRQPWCVPDVTTLDEVIDVVERCPTGALTYKAKDESREEHAQAENRLFVTYNGPYYLQGNLEIYGATDDLPGVRFRAALCRCGQSKNKPFCDNSHEDINFKDHAAVGEKGSGIETTGGKLKAKAIKDGPFVLEGNLSIIAGSGRIAWKGTSAALCRCGASKNKPFCDGSHKEIDFKSE